LHNRASSRQFVTVNWRGSCDNTGLNLSDGLNSSMAKAKTNYTCNECGDIANKWAGQCSACGQWNTLIETPVEAGGNRFSGGFSGGGLVAAAPVQVLNEIDALDVPRFGTGIEEFDRVLGGGLVAGGVVLIGGDPGIGKSTLLLQALANLARVKNVLYVSGEESGAQIAMRARRLQLDTRELKLQAEIQLEKILQTLLEHQPQVVVIDSIQTMYSDALSSAPGSVAQVRECAAQLTRVAKQSGITIIMVGHVTKEGALAGPRVLEHIVDTVLYFEGDNHSSFRLVRAVKNRFGAVNELGVFAMTEKGLKGVANPSALFLSQHENQVPGSCVMVTQEGTRPLLVEIQALVDTSHLPNARRLSVGLDQNRLAMLLAVLHRHAGIAAFDQDVFINAVGGVKITEPAADLAVLAAINSSMRNKALPRGLVLFGEVGLAGEIRPAPRGQERLREAAKLGFSIAMIPKSNAPRQAIEGMRIIAVDRIDSAFQQLREVQSE
jgi:DNA repair protein RadA/Sms